MKSPIDDLVDQVRLNAKAYAASSKSYAIDPDFEVSLARLALREVVFAMCDEFSTDSDIAEAIDSEIDSLQSMGEITFKRRSGAFD